jgi:hypothetical protein
MPETQMNDDIFRAAMIAEGAIHAESDEEFLGAWQVGEGRTQPRSKADDAQSKNVDYLSSRKPRGSRAQTY